MPFISNKERVKVQKSLYKGYGFKKWILFTTLLLSIACITYILLVILGELHIIKIDSFKFVELTDDAYWQLTTYGIIAITLVSITLFGTLLSIILIFTMASPYKITGKVSKLTSSAVPGKKNAKSASRTIKDRY
ncbi:MAG: hypothetical protein LBF00_03550 [Mycoplasmataceae bacterium]|jgi:uncharacterized BrkB/YihY/UPF0761 family membrane protein|nr:hypothetical protein [Mycoplasmataceae bacterium]